MGRLSGFKYRIVAKKLKKLGYSLRRQSGGSHEIWGSKMANKTIVLAKHNKDIPDGTLRSTLKKADIDVSVFLNA